MVPYTDMQMYSLVNDIDSYSEFVPWCVQGHIESTQGNKVLGVLVFSRYGIRYTLKTLNTCYQPHKVELSLVEGPLEKLVGSWAFQSLENGCEVSLELDMIMQSFGMNMLFSSMFDSLSKQLVQIFVERAHRVYASKAID